jgi:hypothetical protein
VPPPTTPEPPPTTPEPRPIPGPHRWACRQSDGKCYRRPDGKYRSKEECEAKCKSKQPKRPEDREDGGSGGIEQRREAVIQQIIVIITGNNNQLNLAQGNEGNVAQENKIKKVLQANNFKTDDATVQKVIKMAINKIDTKKLNVNNRRGRYIPD